MAGAALMVLAFFFLLRVGEYTPSSQPRLTVPLRLKDVKLWRGTRVIPMSAQRHELEEATGVSICLENQKNGRRGDTLFHERSGNPHMCPVEAIVILVVPLRHMGPETPLGSCFDENGMPTRVTARHMRQALRQAAQADNIAEQGFDLERIGTHSLRAGGAVALRLAGYDDTTIRKMGRWSSSTFLIYIRNQVANLATGVSVAMASALQYHNVG